MGRSPFAEPDMIPGMQARCDEIRRLTQEVPIGAERMDFSAVGTLTLVHSDGTLVYLGLCTEPDPKVLCVTYSTNGMKVGDVAIVTGGYRRLGPDFIVLDPCLATRPDDPAQ